MKTAMHSRCMGATEQSEKLWQSSEMQLYHKDAVHAQLAQQHLAGGGHASLSPGTSLGTGFPSPTRSPEPSSQGTGEGPLGTLRDALSSHSLH